MSYSEESNIARNTQKRLGIFALAFITLVFSPRAYEHVRRTFNNHLPHERTIRRWYQNSNIQNEPGINQETVQRLKKIADDFASSNGSKIICSLTFDEVFLRKQIHWSMNQMDYVGQISNVDNEMSAATAAIVFLLNGVNTNFEFPVVSQVTT